MTKPKVRLIWEEDTHGIVTDAQDVDEFIEETAIVLACMITKSDPAKFHEWVGGKIEFADGPQISNTMDWHAMLSTWLGQIVEISCKLKGYKADVVERRLIYSGDFPLPELRMPGRPSADE